MTLPFMYTIELMFVVIYYQYYNYITSKMPNFFAISIIKLTPVAILFVNC